MLHLKHKDLADYFDYDTATDAIWIKGHRIGLDLILDSYLAGKNMEELQEEFDSLTAEELYAAITYYPTIDVLHVGDDGAPPNHAKDPEISPLPRAGTTSPCHP